MFLGYPKIIGMVSESVVSIIEADVTVSKKISLERVMSDAVIPFFET